MLGLLREQQGPVVRILRSIGVDPFAIRSAVEQGMPRDGGTSGAEKQLSATAKRSIDLAYDETRRAKCGNLGPEHLLIGVIREAKSLAGRQLISAGATLERTRAGVAAYHSGSIAAESDGEVIWPPSPTSPVDRVDPAATMKELEIEEGRANLRLARSLLFTSQCLYAGYIASIVVALALNNRSIPTLIITWTNRAIAAGLVATLLFALYFCSRGHWRTPPRDLEGVGISLRALGLMALVVITYFWVNA